LESRQRIGLYGSGEVPRSKRLTSKAVGPKSSGLRFLGDLPSVRRVRPARFSGRGMAGAAIAPVAVVLVIVTVFGLASSLAPIQYLTTAAGPQPPPYNVAGFVYLSDGTTPATSCPITITNTRTGQFLSATTDPDYGAYIENIVPISGDAAPLPGDVIVVVATLGLDTGSSEGTIPDPIGGLIFINVTLGVVIPEFSGLGMSIVGMFGVFAAVAMVTRSKKH